MAQWQWYHFIYDLTEEQRGSQAMLNFDNALKELSPDDYEAWQEAKEMWEKEQEATL
mgnify:CR=1 FL=1